MKVLLTKFVIFLQACMLRNVVLTSIAIWIVIFTIFIAIITFWVYLFNYLLTA